MTEEEYVEISKIRGICDKLLAGAVAPPVTPPVEPPIVIPPPIFVPPAGNSMTPVQVQSTPYIEYIGRQPGYLAEKLWVELQVLAEEFYNIYDLRPYRKLVIAQACPPPGVVWPSSPDHKSDGRACDILYYTTGENANDSFFMWDGETLTDLCDRDRNFNFFTALRSALPRVTIAVDDILKTEIGAANLDYIQGSTPFAKYNHNTHAHIYLQE